MKQNDEIKSIKKKFEYVCAKGLTMLMFFWLSCVPVAAAQNAADMSMFSGVTVSPDKTAWTTDYLDKTNECLEKGYIIETGVVSSLRDLQKGEHYYDVKIKGTISVGKWEVVWPDAQCIHEISFYDTFCGFPIKSDTVCFERYNNGWNAYCADCGEVVEETLFYGKSATIGKITAMPADAIYVYICPYCEGLEQGRGYHHICKAISNNFYEVSYEPNEPVNSSGDIHRVEGVMVSTKHMYNNAGSYNGISAQKLGYGDTHLRENTYSCEGYEFLGWNTVPDGSGIFYSDKAEILNLTNEEGALIRLYAQWKRSQSCLVLDANGGKYDGKYIYERVQDYNTTYVVQDDLLTPAAGYTVSFVTNGGTDIGKITTTKNFSHWEMQAGFQGNFKDNEYVFEGNADSRNVLKAQYINNPLLLPDSIKVGVILEGWYLSPELKEDELFGRPGEYVVVEKDITLYAKWITLTLWAYDDYEAYKGRGAVDLKWEQKDGQSKFYRLFQSQDKENWKEVFESNSIITNNTLSEHFEVNKNNNTFVVPYTGYYKLCAKGAGGADYSVNLKGGLGGSVSAEYWLKKGDVITFYAGSTAQKTNGGTCAIGSAGGSSGLKGSGGGAATEIFLTRDGVKTPLIIAGGGGGANEKYSGGNGGQNLTDIGDKTGKTSEYGGGGGGAHGGTGGGTSVKTTVANTTDYAFKSNLSQKLSPGTVEVYGMSKELAVPSLKKIEGKNQNSWKWITEMGRLSSSFSSGYRIWYDRDDNMFWGISTGRAEVGKVPYIQAQARDGMDLYLSGTYSTNGNTNLLISGGLLRKDYGAAGETRLLVTVTNAETGAIIYKKYAYNGYSANGTAGIAAVVDIDISSARKVTIQLLSETEGTQEYTQGHETQLYFSDIIFYGRNISEATATSGGSSYINTGYGCKNQKSVAGDNTGNGYAWIESVDIGYKEETSLENVIAYDTQAPDIVEMYEIYIAEEDKVKILVEKPMDKGTTYYHKAKSYRMEEKGVINLAESNITENTITTGIAGYYYYVDTQKRGVVNKDKEWISVSESMEGLILTLTEPVMYLHIASADKAGNLSATKDIEVKMDLSFPTDPGYVENRSLHTKQLILEENEYVYKNSEDSYYVKADGITEHRLLAEAYIDGAATKDFQIDQIILCVKENEQLHSEWIQVTIPKGDIAQNSMSYFNSSLSIDMSDGYQNYMQFKTASAQRMGYGMNILLEKRFSVRQDGTCLVVYPKACAKFQSQLFQSDEELDKGNAILIIPDGMPPSITGLEKLKELDVLDMTDQNVWVQLQAEDYESGLGEFSVCVRNYDNFMVQEFFCDEDGKIKIKVEKDDPLFAGNIVISAMAVDRVGNALVIGEHGLTFSLESDLYKERKPEESIFKTGDGAVLDITTSGYVEKLEVIFPEELLQLCPDLLLVYEYEYPYLKHTETIKFLIPFGIPEQEYEIIVKAYKNGEMLVSKQTLVIVRGNVLDELRTRIRNNG